VNFSSSLPLKIARSEGRGRAGGGVCEIHPNEAGRVGGVEHEQIVEVAWFKCVCMCAHVCDSWGGWGSVCP
jgi:hypothetical protein